MGESVLPDGRACGTAVEPRGILSERIAGKLDRLAADRRESSARPVFRGPRAARGGRVVETLGETRVVARLKRRSLALDGSLERCRGARG